ncbi:tRNA preQ1(34) S-adenosylmethionine ribosyltransferase-isomerase QueA [Candidatus Parcubacteria bacterium]|nr:tRNA preQ1(34) S-adenosylmethionine ribosyltransferase-isomerase QueA [Candidatus Parcubacteria bacterium]
MNKKYKLSDFDYNLPKELIAQKPATPRDHSRLLILKKNSTEAPKPPRFCKNRGGLGAEHKHFYDLPGYLKKGDVLVMNNSKVFPARLIGKKKTGGKMEVFLHKFIKENDWQCLIGGRGACSGLEIFFSENLKCKILKNNNDGTWEIKFNMGYGEMMKVVEKIGQVPLPPYIDRKSEIGFRISDKDDYQTVYADDEKIGSVAAPTAGLHFTPELLQKLKDKGVQIEYITLHVGLGTFAPVKIGDITQHKMHVEFVEISSDTLKKLRKAINENRRIIAVGTTSTRTLEAFSEIIQNSPVKRAQAKFTRQASTGKIQNYSGWVDIFIYPGYKFKVIDGMITNFHLPKSTLLMLVSALAGKENIDKAYENAIKNKYRFYSYGDAMLII